MLVFLSENIVWKITDKYQYCTSNNVIILNFLTYQHFIECFLIENRLNIYCIYCTPLTLLMPR